MAPDLPQNARDGGFIAQGYHPPLDELRGLRDESRRLVAALQARLVQETGVNALKVRHNNVLGYYIEVPAGRAETLMKRPETFIHRQTMAGAVRFTTTELADLEDRIRGAADKALALEQALFADLVGEVEARAEAVAGAARALAAIDVAAALAELAERGRYHRPEVGEGTEFSITRGRHPVVESALESGREGSFVANDCDLGPDNRLWLVTGPNMAGKSTFLRQNALIAVLAQTG